MLTPACRESAPLGPSNIPDRHARRRFKHVLKKVMTCRALEHGSRSWFLETVLAAAKARETRLSFLRHGLWLDVSSGSRPCLHARQSPASLVAPPLSSSNPPMTCFPASYMYFATKITDLPLSLQPVGGPPLKFKRPLRHHEEFTAKVGERGSAV